ncbi:MAG: LptA/OstA family protein [Vicinamibacterales bacterium]
MWRKYLRLAIGAFVVIFVAVVAVSLHRGRRAPPAAPVPKGDPNAVLQTFDSGKFTDLEGGKPRLEIKFKRQATYGDNRSVFAGGVTMKLPDRAGRTITVDCEEADVTTPPGRTIGRALLKGGVKLVTSDGITVTSATATYDDTSGVAQIPGPLTFTRGRMSGTAVGGSYDRNRELLSLFDRVKVDVAPEPKGAGAMHVTSKSGTMARLEHYMQFVGGARLDGEGRVTQADQAMAFLTPDNDRVQRMELRGHSTIVAKPGQSGPQDMRAHDIDMTYAPDGRTLQTAHLMTDAVVQLPGDDPGKPGRRIAGQLMDIALAPDGATVTNLTSTGSVQVDIPADGDTPARRIRSAALAATGSAGTGIQAASFTGGVDYRESRAARGDVAAIDRTARSQRLDVKTKPGFCDIEEADFHTSVHFTNGATTTADAPTAIYVIADDRLDLSPETGDRGRGPHVSDGRVTVDARNVHMTLGAQTMKADTNVRSLMQQTDDKTSAQPVHMPSMLKQDQPVNVRSNRLDYDAAKSVATYSGNARLWQEGQSGTVIQSDQIVLEDKTGNLHATTKVVSSMVLTEAADSTPAPDAQAKPPEPTITKADDLLYVDDKHQATYTGQVHMNGPDGDVTADRMDLFLAEQGGQLERAEADGGVVSHQQGHHSTGTHLTYETKTGLYTMVGNPAKMYDDTPPTCKRTDATTLTFDRNGNRSVASGNGTSPQQTVAIPCGGAGTE